MKARVGDFLVVKGTTTERHDQHAEIIAVRSEDGHQQEDAQPDSRTATAARYDHEATPGSNLRPALSK